MTATRSDETKARLFFALDPPEAVRQLLADWQSTELPDPALRPVQPRALHVTLCFLGWVPEPEIAAIGEHLRPHLAEPVELTLEPEPVALPPRRPRLFALSARSEATLRVQHRLSETLAETGVYEPEKRPFWPHFTVARVRSEDAGKRRPRRVSKPPRALPEALLFPFHAVRVALYRSYLRPSGSHYVSLASLELPHPGSTGAEKR